MYIDGVCPDLSFTFISRPPISPLAVTAYIEKLYNNNNNNNNNFNFSYLKEINFSDEFNNKLSEKVSVPFSSYRFLVVVIVVIIIVITIIVIIRPLSASATCISIIPEEGFEYLPTNLKLFLLLL